MASRIQGKTLCLGKAKQVNIATISPSFLTFTQLNEEVTAQGFRTENDAAWIGKGDEFARQVFPVSFDPSASISHYGSTELTTWAWAYALGGVAQTGAGPFDYTINPIAPGTSLELPYFTVVEQVPEGGGKSIDNAFVGCAVEEVTNTIAWGAGLATHKLDIKWNGSGLITSPSGVVAPSDTILHMQLGASMVATINGTNYVSGKDIVGVTLGWKNNLNMTAGLYPGSGTQNGAAVRGRIFIGTRSPMFKFRALLVNGSPEYAALVAQITGTAAVTVSYDSNDSSTWTWNQISYGVVEFGQTNGLVDVEVTIIPQSSSPLTFTSVCAIGGIAQ
jgi:hypothetical protein